jgi:hypothetical protein
MYGCSSDFLSLFYLKRHIFRKLPANISLSVGFTNIMWLLFFDGCEIVPLEFLCCVINGVLFFFGKLTIWHKNIHVCSRNVIFSATEAVFICLARCLFYILCGEQKSS